MRLTTKRVHLMGTFIEISIYHHSPSTIFNDVEKQLLKDNHCFSANDDTSELMAINKAAGVHEVKVSDNLFNLIAIGKDLSLQEHSQLNIAIGPLVKLWNIGFPNAHVPSNNKISKLLALTNPHDIKLDKDQKTVFLTKKGMSIDLGALAKGFIADHLVSLLKENEVTSGVVNLGGNVRTFGPALHHPDHLWRIGIRNPNGLSNDNALILTLRDKSVVTSGIYERYLKHDNQHYHHILDKKTGYPIKTPMHSLSIISETSLEGDCLTSMLFGQNHEVLKQKVTENKSIDLVSIGHSKQITMTHTLSKSVYQLHPYFTITTF